MKNNRKYRILHIETFAPCALQIFIMSKAKQSFALIHRRVKLVMPVHTYYTCKDITFYKNNKCFQENNYINFKKRCKIIENKAPFS